MKKDGTEFLAVRKWQRKSILAHTVKKCLVITLHCAIVIMMEHTVASKMRWIVAMDDEPTIEHGNYRVWLRDNLYHRETGPAIISGVSARWYLHGVEYSLESWLKKIKATPEEKTMLRLKWAK